MLKDKDIGFILHRAAMSAKCNFSNELNEFGITPGQLMVLKEIYHHQENTAAIGLSPACISAGLEFDRPTVSGIIDRLEAQEWVVRLINPNDKRSFHIRLTDKAMSKLNGLEEISTKNQVTILKGFTEGEIVTFKNHLLRVIDNFKEMEE
ncbi:MAG: MarR family transcriptional regulator [Anaerocolumna sp.]